MYYHLARTAEQGLTKSWLTLLSQVSQRENDEPLRHIVLELSQEFFETPDWDAWAMHHVKSNPVRRFEPDDNTFPPAFFRVHFRDGWSRIGVGSTGLLNPDSSTRRTTGADPVVAQGFLEETLKTVSLQLQTSGSLLLFLISVEWS